MVSEVSSHGFLKRHGIAMTCTDALPMVSRRSMIATRAEAEAAEAPATQTEKSGNSFAALKDIEAIQEILPHR